MYLNGMCKIKFREPYKFEKNDKEEEDVSVGEDAPEEEEDVEHELTRASRLISHLV